MLQISINIKITLFICFRQEKRVEDTSDMLWQDKYRPLITKDLVGNPGAVEQLKTWLNSWYQMFQMEYT